MNIHPPQKHRLVKSMLRPAYYTARSACQRVKNQFLNLIDQPLIILIYHRVTDLEKDTEMLAVSPENFRAQIKFLKQHYRIVRFEEDWSKLKEKAVVITFDDGYADNALEALPILEEIGVPATFFISTCHIGTDKQFWWDQLEVILLEDRKFPSSFKLDDASYGQLWDTDTSQKRKLLYEALNELMKRISPDRREVWLGQLRQWMGNTVDNVENTHRSMTQDELIRLSASPWTTIGAHTVTHTALSVLSEKEQQEEIISSKQELERITKTEITTFAYPYGGKNNYNQTSIRLCREAGIKKAASSFPGQVHRWADNFQLPRQLVRNWDLDTFTSKVRSFWTL